MRLPSLEQIFQKSGLTLKRFPLVILAAAVAVIASVYLAGQTQPETHLLYNLILVAILGIPLFTVVTLSAERKDWTTLQTGIVSSACLILLAGYYFTFPDDLDAAPYKHVYRYLLYFLALHALVAFGPYVKSEEIHTFWEYNKTLFLRFLTAIFFSAVLFAGLAVALGSVQVLLDVNIKGVRYFQLFLIIAGLFNTWFFLAGIPALKVFKSAGKYPKGLKIFTQNILIPLVVIYLAILYLYTGKIILEWAWPEGWVAYLVLSFSIAGILALLLLYPIREKEDTKWIKPFSNGFFIALIPLVILLLLAILRRIWEYSFTIERYFVLILGLWLAGVVAYFLFNRKQNIKVIPASLCVLAFLISFGPWGAFSVSERSQINRLEQYLTQNDMLNDGGIQQASEEVSFDDRQEISSIVRYLNENHGLSGIQPWFEQDLDSLYDSNIEGEPEQLVSFYRRPAHVVELMGIEYVNYGAALSPATMRNEFHSDRNNIILVDSVRYLIKNVYWSENLNRQRYSLEGGNTIVIDSDPEAPHISIYREGVRDDVIVVDITAVIQSLKENHSEQGSELSSEEMTFSYSTESLEVTLYFENIVWNPEKDQQPVRAGYMVGIK